MILWLRRGRAEMSEVVAYKELKQSFKSNEVIHCNHCLYFCCAVDFFDLIDLFLSNSFTIGPFTIPGHLSTSHAGAQIIQQCGFQ